MEVEFHSQALKHQLKPILAFLFEVTAYEPAEERPPEFPHKQVCQ
jgi:hypothetical protein